MKNSRYLLGALLALVCLAALPARAQFLIGLPDNSTTLASNDDDHFPTVKAVRAYIAAHTTDFGTLTVTASTGTLTIADGKTVTVSNTITLAGTDSTTITLPSTSATMARTDAAQTFTGNQTFGTIIPTTITGGGAITSSSALAGIGYATGAGGTVTQITSRTTGVTLSKICGKVQTDPSSLAAGASATFTVTNTAVAIGDVVVVSIRSGATNNETSVAVTAVAAGSFDITVHNQHASTAETGAIVINFAVIKAVSA